MVAATEQRNGPVIHQPAQDMIAKAAANCPRHRIRRYLEPQAKAKIDSV
jgi:hypothetical protein